MRKYLWTLLGPGALVAGGLLFGSIGPATVASAAHVAAHSAAAPHRIPIPDPPCYGASCNNQDPFTTSNAGGSCGVATAYNQIIAATADYTDENGNAGTLYNLYSTWCNANWAATDDPPGDGLALAATTDGAYAYEPLDLFSSLNFYDGGGAMWTDMVDGSGPATATVYQPTTPGLGDPGILKITSVQQ